MRVGSSLAKSRNIDVNIETMAQAALERNSSTHQYQNSIINSREVVSSRAVLDAKAKQLRMNDYDRRRNRAQSCNSAEELRLILV